MSTKRAAVRAPSGLGVSGKALWKGVIGDLQDGWELDARELHLLERAGRCADEIALLERIVDEDGPTTRGSRGQVVAHPALQEVRQLRLVEFRLLAALELEDPSVAALRRSPVSRRATRAAASRHSGRVGAEAVEGYRRRLGVAS